jgi:hypothetical protein
MPSLKAQEHGESKVATAALSHGNRFANSIRAFFYSLNKGYVRSTCNFSRQGMCPVKFTLLDRTIIFSSLSKITGHISVRLTLFWTPACL